MDNNSHVNLATGSSVALIVRVGDGVEEIGTLQGFNSNPLCDVMVEHLVLSRPKHIRCRRALTGRYVSIRVVVTSWWNISFCRVLNTSDVVEL